jgi:ribose 5-phosphate isomerase RpiB
MRTCKPSPCDDSAAAACEAPINNSQVLNGASCMVIVGPSLSLVDGWLTAAFDALRSELDLIQQYMKDQTDQERITNKGSDHPH